MTLTWSAQSIEPFFISAGCDGKTVWLALHQKNDLFPAQSMIATSQIKVLEEQRRVRETTAPTRAAGLALEIEPADRADQIIFFSSAFKTGPRSGRASA